MTAVLQGLLYLAYPFVVYFAHTHWGTRSVALILLVGLLGGMALRRGDKSAEIRSLLRQHTGLVVLVGLALVAGERIFLLLLPSLVGLFLLFTFGRTLFDGPSMIERFARIIEDDLPPFTASYCRKVTIVWCVFFAVHAAVAGVLAFRGPLSWWAAYSGVIVYVVIGGLLGVEFLLRKWWFRYYTGGVLDSVLARLFPPEATARGRRSLAYDAARRERALSTSRSEAS
ncbi:MAG: hypothetical protein MJE66_19235 [Proteobacteria bacterium]|nr:hypothetical protein [Pseudomonadota bacterium]